MPELICRIKPYLQPFEKVLAVRELCSLAQLDADLAYLHFSNDVELQIDTEVPMEVLTRKLAYWESISNGTGNLTIQVLREATVNIVKNGILPQEIYRYSPPGKDVSLPRRRCLRYGPHGIHEYRGKFFPQLVRSLANIADLRETDLVLDPMCGSGTTLVESVLLGCKAFGLDTNPLSVLISATKCAILSAHPNDILKAYQKVLQDLKRSDINLRSYRYNWLKGLPIKDSEYLRGWFPPVALAHLDKIIRCIRETHPASVRNLFILSLSNILRRVSYQKTDDLRVRKEIYDETSVDCTSIFSKELERVIKLVLAFLYGENRQYNKIWYVKQGDSREISRCLPEYVGKINAIITSPPYATALPYIDTDRLSLSFLGLLPRAQFREINLKMIGNREITDKIKTEYWDRYTNEKRLLPSAIAKKIDSIYKLNQSTDVGFRRKNLPSLLSKYFLDMRNVFIEMKRMLAPGAPAYLVIGNNHTVAGGKKVDITTDDFLCQMGESIGLKLEHTIPMDMLVSRDIFKKNAVKTETILCFRNAED